LPKNSRVRLERTHVGGTNRRAATRGARAALLHALLWAALAVGTPLGDARGVIIEAGDGTGNVSAPPDDPGWANLGTRGSTTVVYLGRSWVITASHVGAGDVVFEGQTYAAIPGSTVRFQNPDATLADLIVFKLYDDPGLPRLKLLRSAPAVGDPLITIGNGLNRGSPTTFLLLGGYNWGTGHSMRWGTNVISDTDIIVNDTYSFAATFSDPLELDATADESAAANGDSGGAAFIKVANDWYLAGTLFAISQYPSQPPTTSIYGNKLFAADLAFYRADILTVIDQKSCANGLDDDGDGFTDYPADPECLNANDDSESIREVPALGRPGRAALIGSMLLLFGLLARRRHTAV